MEKEFKIGDKIIINQGKNNWNPLMNQYVDKVFTIKTISNFNTTFEESTSEMHRWQWTVRNNHFRHYEEPIKEFPKFQITRQENTISKKNVIKEVVNNEGNTFEVGDIVIPFRYTPLCKEPSKIIRFRYNKDNSNICAVLDEKFPNGIGIDKLQHFVEFKPKEPEFVLPEKWCIKNINKEIGEYFENIMDRKGTYTNTNLNSYRHNKHVDGRNIELKSNGSIASYKIRDNFTEITFEQFQKYILKKQELPVQNIVQELPQEESLLDKAKRLYPIGTKVKSNKGTIGISNGKYYTNNEYDIQYICMKQDNNSCGLEVYNRNNGWLAEIIKD